jgi:uncharacterized protein YjbJ (UPF0337 family)
MPFCLIGERASCVKRNRRAAPVETDGLESDDAGQNSSPNDPDIVELKPHRQAWLPAFANGAVSGVACPSSIRETTMNWDQIQNDWLVFKNRLRHNWNKLTDEDITRISGRREELVARLQERYGFARCEAEREIGAWVRAQKRAA